MTSKRFHRSGSASNALADAFLACVREVARLFAIAGYDAGPVPESSLLDLEALFRETEAADTLFLQALESEVRLEV